jgi:hypothetical protein
LFLHHRLVISICLTPLLITTNGSLALAEDDSEGIKKLCMAGFNAAMSQAGHAPPEGMGDFTCSCFAKEIKGIAFIMQAQAICKELAAEKYGPLLKIE